MLRPVDKAALYDLPQEMRNLLPKCIGKNFFFFMLVFCRRELKELWLCDRVNEKGTLSHAICQEKLWKLREKQL